MVGWVGTGSSHFVTIITRIGVGMGSGVGMRITRKREIVVMAMVGGVSGVGSVRRVAVMMSVMAVMVSVMAVMIGVSVSMGGAIAGIPTFFLRLPNLSRCIKRYSGRNRIRERL